MVIDSTDRERLAVTREELYRMLQHEDLSKASLLVYANKQVGVSQIPIRKIKKSQNKMLLSGILNQIIYYCIFSVTMSPCRT